MHRILFTGALSALVALSALGADRHFEKKFTVSPGGTLTLATDVGSVDVAGTQDNEVSVVADLHGRQRDVDGFDLTTSQTASGVDVKGRGARHNFWSWGSNDLDIRFVIKVPRQYSVSLNTAGGDIAISALQGTARGETSGGTIRISGIEGPVNLTTSGGDVHADNVKGTLHLETSGGSIAIAGATGDVDVSTSGGNIHINDVDGNVRAETSGGNVVVKLRKENKGIYVETSGGNIDIVMDKGVGATIDASTSGGGVVCDLPISVKGRIDESSIHGDINGGGKTIHAHTSGGDVRIRPL